MAKVGIYTQQMCQEKRKKNNVQTVFVSKTKYLDRTQLDLWLTRHATPKKVRRKETRSPRRAKLIPVCINQFHKSADIGINLTVYTEKLFFFKYLVCFHPNKVMNTPAEIAAISVFLPVGRQ